MTTPQVTVRLDERAPDLHIAYVTIDNEAKLNTLNSALMGEFLAVIATVSSNPALRAVVITGAGHRAFIGGADVNEMAALDSSTCRAFITKLHRCCQVLRDLPVPVIAKIHGYALGAGLEIAAACDLRIAAETAHFGMPEVKLGIPSVIDAALLPSLIGWGRTRQMLMLGETINAAQASQWGLVEMVVLALSLDEQVERWIASILQAGPQAVRLQKKLIRKWEDLPVSAAIDAGVDAFEEAWRTDEPKLRMQEFIARRAKAK